MSELTYSIFDRQTKSFPKKDLTLVSLRRQLAGAYSSFPHDFGCSDGDTYTVVDKVWHYSPLHDHPIVITTRRKEPRPYSVIDSNGRVYTVKELFELMEGYEYKHEPWRYHRGCFEYRQDPVPGTSKSRGGDCYRSIRRGKRELAALEFFPTRTRTLMRKRELFSRFSWDDTPYKDESRSWKKHRKAQWKGSGVA